MYKRKQIDFLRTTRDFVEDAAEESEKVIQEFSPKQKKKFFTWGKIAPTAITFILLLGLVYTTRAVISSNDLAHQLGNASVFEQIKHLAVSGDKPLLGEDQERINILLLGIGGEEHDGGQLTDTIIVASINPLNGETGLLSIPRDLVAPIPGVGWQKINSANAYGAAMNPDEIRAGADLSKKTVSAITSLSMHYYIKLDFEGFVKMVDALGGIRVDIPSEFTDYQYPDDSFGYEPVHFDSGWQNLKGNEALKYVRSRHGTDGEGTDFARARRQQQILQALQARTLALSTLINPNKLLSLSDIIGEHVETDMKLWQLFRLYEIAKKADKQNITQVVLSTEQGGLLIADTNEEGSYLLRPRLASTDFSEIKKVARNLLYQDPMLSVVSASDIAEGLKIVIHNGTLSEGLAANTALELEKLSYNITQIANSPMRDYEKTVIYKLSDQVPASDMQLIIETLNANVAPSLPNFITVPDADMLIIVGSDSVS